jgi:hypothetical protein
MHTEKREEPLADMGYEVRDVNYKGLRTATTFFFGFTVFAAIAGYVIYRYWANPSLYTTQGKKVERLLPQDPNPRLQDNVTAKTDLMDLRQAEDKILDGTPVEKKDGTYQIPIEAAKAMVIETGGHTDAASAGTSTGEVSRPNEVGSAEATPGGEPLPSTEPTSPDPTLPRGTGTGGRP